MPAELQSICDFIRYATSQANRAGVSLGQGFDSTLDEACFLILRSLHLPPDLPPAYAASQLTAEERIVLLQRIEQRVEQRIPTAYLVGEAWFAGAPYQVRPGVLIPRSPIAELIQAEFSPWLSEDPARILDLCCGSGCIGIASAHQFPDSMVDLVDISDVALEVAASNIADHGVEDRVSCVRSDLFAALEGQCYDLILSNPPYVPDAEVDGLPPEFGHEPALALRSGADGLDLPLRILADCARFLSPSGMLVLEVGATAEALVAALPQLGGHWPEFEHGGDGVVMLQAEEVRAVAAAAAELCAGRGLGSHTDGR